MYGYSTRTNDPFTTESNWNLFVDSTSANSKEREFKAYIVDQNVQNVFNMYYFYCTLAGAEIRLDQIDSGYMIQSAYWADSSGQLWEYYALLF